MHYSGEVENIYTASWQIYSGQHVQYFIINGRAFLDNMTKTFWSVFSVQLEIAVR